MKLKLFQQIALMLVAGIAGLGIGVAIMWNGHGASAATNGNQDLILHAGIEATCEHAGVRDYWEDADTHICYSDANGLNVITEDLATWKVMPQVEHKTNANCFYAHENATCAKEGHQAYYTCAYGCGAIFTDAECKHAVTMTEIALPKIAHTLKHVDYEDATCEHDGHKDHYACLACGATFADEAGKMPFNPVIKTQHNVTFVERQAATCEEDGHIAHYECETCHRKFADSACTQPLTDAEVVLEHNGHRAVGQEQYKAAKEANCTENGNPEYWICNDCGTFFYDADLTQVMDPSVLEEAQYQATKPEGHAASDYQMIYAPQNRADATMPCRYVDEDGNLVAGSDYVYYYKTCPDCGAHSGNQGVPGFANLLSTDIATWTYETDDDKKVLADIYTVNKANLTASDNGYDVAIRIDVAANYSSYSQYQFGDNVVTDMSGEVTKIAGDKVFVLNVHFDAEPSNGDSLVWQFNWDGDVDAEGNGIYEQIIKVVIAA